MIRHTVLLPIFSALLQSATAQSTYADYVTFGGNSSAPINGYQSFRKADQMPNETHSVTFDHSSIHKNWTWTVKISDVVMPNSTGTNLDTLTPNPPPNAHVAFTTYDFAWPGGGSLNDAVREGENLNSPISSSNPSCMYMIITSFPLNVSEKYDPSSSDCTSALGDECVSTILAGMTGDTGCDTHNFPTYYQYRDACADSFGVAVGSGITTKAIPFGNATAPKNQTSLQSGGTWAWQLSNPYAPDNTTAFEMEKDQLRVIGLSTRGQNQLLCNRVAETIEGAASPSVRLGGVAIVSVVAMVVAVVSGM